MTLPLTGVQVIEVGVSVGGAFCGKQLAELGARVVMIEPPGGGRTRVGPFGDPSKPETSAPHLFLDTAKESVVLDWPDPARLSEVLAHVRAADVVLHSLAPAAARRIGLMPAQAIAAYPEKVFAAVTPFGMEGPWAEMPATEMTVAAIDGYMQITGDPGREPLYPFAHVGEHAAGQVATIAVLAALRARRRDGIGDYADIALIEANNATLDGYVVAGYSYQGRNRERAGNLIGAYDIIQTKDGFVHVASLSQEHWRGLALAMGHPDLIDDPRLNTPQLRIANPSLIMEYLGPWAKELTSVEALYAIQEMRVPSAISESIADLLADPQIEAREFLVDIDHPVAGTAKYPARHFISDTLDLRIERAPLLGEARSEASATRRTRLPLRSEARPPLEGVRVVDLTQVWAAPFATVLLSELGADVIHIESPTRPDMTRWWTVNLAIEGPLWEKSAYYSQHNRGGKRSLILDLSHEPAREVIRDLIAKSDILLNNFSARVMGNWGFTYEAVRELNPKIVYLAMPSYGMTGPYRDFVGFGEALEGACGMVRHRGYGPERPLRSGSAMSDPYASYAAATLMLAALDVRDQTGSSVYLDLAQRDAAVRLIGDEFVGYQLTGEDPGQWNNAHREFVPHRAYRCAGADRWVTIAARSDDEWSRLCHVIERPDLAREDGLATVAGRRTRQAEVDAAIEAWTSVREPAFVETQLLRAGVPAGYVRPPSEFVEHPQFVERGFFPWTPHPIAGERRLHSTPVMLRGRPETRTNRRAPIFGEHTREVLSGVLGYTAARIDELEAAGAVGGEPNVEGVIVIS